MWYLYILKSLKNNSYYIGITGNIRRRLYSHNVGDVKATKYKRPYRLVFQQEFPNKEKASVAEKRITKWKRRDFIDRIIRDGRIKFAPVVQRIERRSSKA